MQYSLTYRETNVAIDSHGGELVSFRDSSGLEYIWSGDPAFWSGRNPLLFPIVGNLKNGEVSIQGRTYRMSRHGFARDNEFTLLEKTDDSITLELRENRATLECYPFPFSLQVCHRVMNDRFSTTYRVENTGGLPMPFCIGAHTAFRCPLRAGERFEDYAVVFDSPQTASMRLLSSDGLLTELREPVLEGQDSFPLDRSVFSRVDTMIFDDLSVKAVSLLNLETGHGVRMEFSGFPMLAFWTKGDTDAPFICMEPWHGCAALTDETGNFTDKPGCIVLSAGESKTFSYTVYTR